MNRDEIFKRVVGAVALQFGVEPGRITEATSLKGDLNGDSLDDVELVMELENVFELVIPDEAVDQWETVGDVVEYLNNQINEGESMDERLGGYGQ